MKRFTCPKCKKEGISLKDKYRASIWQVIYCDSCGARLCAQPFLLAFAYFIYTWAVVSFVTIAIFKQSFMPILYMIIVWLILDFINVMSMPLSVMRAIKKPP
jgi:hypothetical protein